jgi:hypothetical protein
VSSVACKVRVAYGSNALATSPSYTDIASMCQTVSVRRGRQYLTDRTEAGTAQVGFADKTGLLDPTNASSAFYPINPNCPAQLQLLNPVTSSYVTIYQGLTQSIEQTALDGGARVNRGVIPMVDLFSLLALQEVPPSTDFASGGTGSKASNTNGNITYVEETVQDRIKTVLADCGVPSGMTDIYSGNVRVQQTTYSPGYSSLAAIQDAADAEFPGVANFFIGKDGRANFRGRMARFDPGSYESHSWNVGDIPTVAANPTTHALVALADFVFDRDVNRVINNALFCPRGITDADIGGQLVYDATSITKYGSRSLSGMDLLNAGATTGPNAGDPLAECQMFGDYYVANFKNPGTRITNVTLRPVSLSAANASVHWNLVCNVEIGDQIAVTVDTPYGTGFGGDLYFVEGLEYQLVLGGAIPNVTLRLDLSPATFWATMPPHWDNT